MRIAHIKADPKTWGSNWRAGTQFSVVQGAHGSVQKTTAKQKQQQRAEKKARRRAGA
jgi:hypothetical protein